ncbi:protein tramtrack, beta isoform-like isoform X2 [Sitophilus oryzae]|uniref:Protein tramtrack, beta isoform-like isoform X2 n=1 Tax=Sitophilus oryzae TaxID=7048 RepID=A0A6J2XQS8_SITOR|nr:protein tramtrack, beta isoform-like isoform X2 [Sitophilus oryzae]
MEAPAEICENYQLKWSSHNTYIHSCISSSLVTDDTFADVALVTLDGHKIMAHRFVLAYASQYLNKALRFQPKVTTALPLMIVLPQSITYKALKILVKYMYSGEATVSKDILNVVLKAGDILKIKGLYREQTDEEQQKAHKNRVGGTGPISTSEPSGQKQKEQRAQEALSKNPPPLVVSAGSSSNPKKTDNQANKALQSRLQQKIQEKVPISAQVTSESNQKKLSGPRVLNFSMTNNFNGSTDKENSTGKKTILLNPKIAQQVDKPHTITSADAESEKVSNSTVMAIKRENEKTDNLSYLVIKDEPLEWTENEMEIIEEKDIYPDGSPKGDTYDSTSNEGSNAEMYTPLTCELCTETFTIPAEWVKHVQTHTDMLPAKRRRRDSPDEDDSNANYPELQCDLCDKPFPTPAEWVRHIQDTHTEFELSMSNRRNQEKKSSGVRKYKLVMK